MTNEEKSYEILKAIVKNNQSLEYYKQQGPYEAAMQMAEWKDRQFSAYLKERVKRYAGSCASQDAALYNELNEIHKELFGELAHDTIPNHQ